MNIKSALLLFLLLGTAVSGRAATIFSFAPAPVTASVGDTFDLHVVVLFTQAPVGAFAFDVAFPAFLQVLSDPTEEGLFAATGCCFGWNSIDNVNGLISGLSDFSGVADFGVDLLVDIPFTAVAVGTGQITFQNVSLSDSNGDAVAVDTLGTADVTVTPAPEPSTWGMAGVGVAIAAAWRKRRTLDSLRTRNFANRTDDRR